MLNTGSRHPSIDKSEIKKLKIGLQIESITDHAQAIIHWWSELEKEIHDDILRFSEEKPQSELEKHIWWIELVGDEDLGDEYAINKSMYRSLILEAKIRLQESKMVDGESYAWTYLEYVKILGQITTLLYINSEIQKRFDPPNLV